MAEILIATEQDKSGTDVTIYVAQTIAGSPVYPFYLKNYAELMEAGLAQSLLYSSNRTKAVYATIDNKVVGNIVYEIQEDVFKSCYLLFSAVDENFRQRGILKLMHKHFEVIIKKQGAKKLYSFVHVDNAPRIASCVGLGLEKQFYKMYKVL
jgi:ribosomal protein S18 acetylase RimI-like enzyme